MGDDGYFLIRSPSFIMQKRNSRVICIYTVGALVGGCVVFVYFYSYHVILFHSMPPFQDYEQLFLKALPGAPLGALTNLSLRSSLKSIEQLYISIKEFNRVCWYTIMITSALITYIFYNLVYHYYIRAYFLIAFRLFTYEYACVWFTKSLFVSLFTNAFFIWSILLSLRCIWFLLKLNHLKNQVS